MSEKKMTAVEIDRFAEFVELLVSHSDQDKSAV